MDERTVSTVEDTWRRFESAGVASLSWARVVCAAAGVFAVLGWPVTAPGKSLYPLGDTVENERLSKDVIPFKTPAQIQARPKLFGEIGDPFLDTGKLSKGFEVPLLGAIWQPRLWAYYIYRTAFQTFDNGVAQRETEWSNRLDVYANLQLTGTEKLFLGLRPLDNNVPNRFTRYTFSGANDDFNNELNLDIETLFFEGDLGSLIPSLDRAGVKPLDFGFTVGRQPLTFQEGILINDTIDAVGFIRNNIVFPGTSNLRVSGIWGWNRLDRSDTRDGADPQMYGLFTAVDSTTTINETGPFAAGDVTLTVPDETVFAVNDTIYIDQEQLTVTVIAVNTLTVVRGVNNTTDAAHADLGVIYIVNSQLPTNVGVNVPFKIELIPAKGAPFSVTRISPIEITTVMDLR